MRPVFKRLTILAVLLGALAFTGCTTPEAQFPTFTNDARKAVGLGPLSTEPPGGTQIYNRARDHAQAMCNSGRIYHSALSSHYQPVGAWKSLSENVGQVGWNQADQASWSGSTNALWNAFMNSASHKANILGNWNFQVVAQVVCGDGRIYVTHVFLRY